MVAIAKPTLAKFPARPDTKPASEFINGQIFQKPMPQEEHSLLQTELCKVVNAIAKPDKIAHYQTRDSFKLNPGNTSSPDSIAGCSNRSTG
ncbi:MAG: Uma2 family endonuclease [Cyanobacteria bacterium J06635_1]